MRFISILFVVVCICSSIVTRDVTFDQQWKLWKDNHKKNYLDAEEHHRRAIWQENLKTIEEHNRQADLGVYTYRLGMNQFADLTNEEFVQKFIGKTQRQDHQKRQTLTPDVNIELPDTVDWRTAGVVTEVKDQGQCGSSGAFALVGVVESWNALRTRQLVSLSAEQIVDCAYGYGMGCNGIIMDSLFQYFADARGLESEDDYPYTGRSDRCAFNASKIAVEISEFAHISSQDEYPLQLTVAGAGPVAVFIDASHESFQFYHSGVYNEPACSQIELDHGVLVVGYGNLSSIDYWIVKNSWGTSWGNKGYIYMSRNKNNQCGIATAAVFPFI